MMLRRVLWHPTAKQAIRTFPKPVRDELGYLIYRLQCGDTLDMPYSNPMPSIAKGAYELRSRGVEGVYRVFYYLKLEEGILIFHCFRKKTRKTPVREIHQAVKNLVEFL